MIRAVALLIGLVSPLLFPALVAAVFVAGAALILPPIGLVAGVLADALYHTPGQPAPFGTLVGGGITLLAYGVHRFVKTRIM